MESRVVPAKQRVSGLCETMWRSVHWKAQGVDPNRGNLLWGAIAGTMWNLVVRGGLKSIVQILKSFRFTSNIHPARSPLGAVCL